MRITRRTSGGRGEYEISESTADGYTPGDLLDRELVLVLPSGWQIRTGTVLKMQGGKPRLRRTTTAPMQLPRQLAAALLLPEPVRADAALGSGAPVVQDARYAIEHIPVDMLDLSSPGAARLHISRVILRNATHSAEELDVQGRVIQVAQVWNRASEFPEYIAKRLREHRTCVQGGGPIPVRVETAVHELQAQVSTNSSDLGVNYSQQLDVMQALESSLRIETPEPVVLVDEVDPEDEPVRMRTIKEWKRWANSRGPKSAVFRQNVRRAYRATCLVCGKRYPPTPYSAPGVDAAHILPWSKFELDDVSNGICLCKLHHWAFDEGLLHIIHEGGNYATELPENIETNLHKSDPGFSTETLREAVGTIPSERLPERRVHWPKPQYLRMLNDALSPIT